MLVTFLCVVVLLALMLAAHFARGVPVFGNPGQNINLMKSKTMSTILDSTGSFRNGRRARAVLSILTQTATHRRISRTGYPLAAGGVAY
jgi:hypothetical protein